MSSHFQKFKYVNDTVLRTMVLHRNPWFVLDDIIKGVGFGPRYAVQYNDDESFKFTYDSNSVYMISLPAVMRVLAAIGNSAALRYRKWIDEVVVNNLLSYYNEHVVERPGVTVLGSFVSSDVEMGNYTVHHSDEFATHRSVRIEGEVYYAAMQICPILGIKQARRMVETYCKDRKMYSYPRKNSRYCEYIINAEDLKKLVRASGFLKKEEFIDWMTGDVADATALDYSFVPIINKQEETVEEVVAAYDLGEDEEITTVEVVEEVTLPAVVEPEPDKKDDGFELFEHPEFGSIRITDREGNPWFVGVDIAKALGYREPTRALSQHCKKSIKSTISAKHTDGKKLPPVNVNLIPESDVYRLIFGSKLESAEKFQDWVFEEVLPSIRKTGKYSLAVQEQAPSVPEIQQVFDPRVDKIIMMLEALHDQGVMHDDMLRALGSSSYHERLDNGNYLTVDEIPWFGDVFEEDRSSKSAVMRKLKSMSNAAHAPFIIRSWGETAPMYERSAFDRKIINRLFALLKEDVSILRKYRKRNPRFLSRYLVKDDTRMYRQPERRMPMAYDDVSFDL